MLVGALADIFITGGGGTGGGAGDLGNAGGGGGGGVVFYPGASLASGVAYPWQPAGANPTHFGASPQPMYLVAVRGGAVVAEAMLVPQVDLVVVIIQLIKMLAPVIKTLLHHLLDNPLIALLMVMEPDGSGLTGGSAGQPMPTALYGGNPMSPYIPQNEFGRGVNRSSPGDQGSGCGGNGSNPPGSTGQGPGSSGSVVVRIYSP